jgi:NADH:ubiquinone oxidoreductase subunit 5 (subunit L)/multisubunit Na+/H+ antiporter MnhA subunit
MFNVNSKFLAILALIMVFAMILCMGVAVFADDHDHDHEDEKDDNKEPTWWDNYNQIIGWVIAVILGVAIVIVSVWWIKSGYKPAKK